MPILDLQKSLRRLGRIRMGNQVPTSNGNTRPNKLSNWRLTSPSEGLLQAAATRYGGEVRPWDGAPGTQAQWELFTETPSLEALIPPGDMAFQQFYEMWSAGGCMRRCDGETELLSNESCLCPTGDERQELAAKGKACKPVSRLFVVLPYLPDVGMWHMEAHGFYAATELPATIEIIRLAASNGNLIPAHLRIDQRSVKRDGQTINFAVPVIELPTLTPHALMSGSVQQLEPVRPQLAAVEDDLAAETGVWDPHRIDPETGELLPVGVPTPPAPTQVRQTYKPRNPPDTADGSSFLRLIRSAAKTKGLDDEQLEVVALEVCKKPVAECTDQKSANELLRAIKERPKAAVS